MAGEIMAQVTGTGGPGGRPAVVGTAAPSTGSPSGAPGAGTALAPTGDRRGEAGLSALDRAQAADFVARYAGRTPAPVAVVIAAYNEEASVASVVKALPAQLCGLATEAVVVVDGSTDRTAEVAEEAGALVSDVPANRGQGAALRLGYHLARLRGARYILTTDADGQYQSGDMERVLAPLVGGEADFVSGSRRLGSTTSKDTVRNLGVVVFAALISVLVRRRVTDPSCGLRALRAEVTASVVLDQPQYQASELLIGTAMAGYRVKEVPIAMKARRSGKTKKGGNLVYGMRFCSVVLRTWWRERSTNTKRS
ncbi:MAG: glycosyltransferase family 2 protein [Acidimicrobiales bacterium]